MSYALIHAGSFLLCIYAIYIILGIFFSQDNRSMRNEMPYLAAYYVCVEVAYLVLTSPILAVLVHLVFMTGYGYYKSRKWLKSILVSLVIFGLFLGVEILAAIPSSFIATEIYLKHEYMNIWSVVFFCITVYFLAHLMKNVVRVRHGYHIPMGYWITLLILPIGSMFIFSVVISSSESRGYEYVLIALMLLGMNFATFHLYDVASKYAESKTKEVAYRQLSNSYNRQLELIKESNEKVRRIRHDLKAHLSMMNTLVGSGQYDKLAAYLRDYVSDFEQFDDGRRTGHVIIDSILNYELDQLPDECEVRLEFDPVPEELDIFDSDLTIIFYNVLSNAVRALKEDMESHSYDLKIKYRQGMLLILSKNTHNGRVISWNGEYITTKVDEENHGLGLKILKTAAEKYDGEIRVVTTADSFDLELFIYC